MKKFFKLFSRFYYIMTRTFKGKCENCGILTPRRETCVYYKRGKAETNYEYLYLCKNCYERYFKNL